MKCKGKTTTGKPCAKNALYAAKKCDKHATDEQKAKSKQQRHDDGIAALKAALESAGGNEVLYGCGNGVLDLPPDFEPTTIYVGEPGITKILRRLMKAGDDASNGCFYVMNGRLVVVRTLPEPLAVREGATPEEAARLDALGKVCTARLEEVDDTLLSAILRELATFYDMDKFGQIIEGYPHKSAIAELMRVGNFNFPQIRRITSTPFVLPGFEIATKPGFYESAGVLLVEDPETEWLDVSEFPSEREIAVAKAHLRWLNDGQGNSGGFPYVAESDRANAVAMDFTPLLQPLLGLIPLFFINAPKHGTGKTYRAMLTQATVMGRVVTRTASKNNDEFTKGYQTAMLAGHAVNIFDNVNHPLDNAEVAQARTSGTMAFRTLGIHGDATVSVDGTDIYTLNNARLTGELLDRGVGIRLDARTENPGDRSGFAYSIPGDVVRDLRPKTVWAMLTIIRAWAAAGQPAGDGGGFRDNFRQWSEVLNGVVAFAGFPGFLKNREEILAAHIVETDETVRTRAVVQAVLASGMQAPTIRELIDKTRANANAFATEAAELMGGDDTWEDDDDETLAALMSLAPVGTPEEKLAAEIGKAIRPLIGKTARVNGVEYVFDLATRSRKTANRYAVKAVEEDAA